MANRRVIHGVTFTQFFTIDIPTVPGVLAVGFFGTAGDAINGNRVAGGPPFANIGNPPIISSSYLTTGMVGTAATATATQSGGAINAVNVTNGGSAYVLAPAVTFGGGGTGASATAVIGGGAVTGFTNLVGGTGFTTPTVAIAGGNNSALDLGVTRASVLSAGWTVAWVSRGIATGADSTTIGDQVNLSGQTGLAVRLNMRGADSLHSNMPTVKFYQNTTERQFLTLPSAITNFRYFAQTYTGGTTGTFQLYSLSDNLTATPYTTTAIGSAQSQQFHIGPHNAGQENTNLSDTAYVMICSGALSLATLQTQYAAVKSALAARGIVVV